MHYPVFEIGKSGRVICAGPCSSKNLAPVVPVDKGPLSRNPVKRPGAANNDAPQEPVLLCLIRT